MDESTHTDENGVTIPLDDWLRSERERKKKEKLERKDKKGKEILEQLIKHGVFTVNKVPSVSTYRYLHENIPKDRRYVLRISNDDVPELKGTFDSTTWNIDKT